MSFWSRWISVASLGLAALGTAPVADAALISEDGAFGPGSFTHDTATGLRWLDIAPSIGFSYAETLTALEPGGMFEGFRLASGAEVFKLFADAGFDTQAGGFVPQNHDPAIALADLVGLVGHDGSCGQGCNFDYTQGWVDNGATPDFQHLLVDGFAWFDNSAGISPTDPMAPVGRFGGGSRPDQGPFNLGAWLVEVPEPAAPWLAVGAWATLGLLAKRRR